MVPPHAGHQLFPVRFALPVHPSQWVSTHRVLLPSSPPLHPCQQYHYHVKHHPQGYQPGLPFIPGPQGLSQHPAPPYPFRCKNPNRYDHMEKHWTRKEILKELREAETTSHDRFWELMRMIDTNDKLQKHVDYLKGELTKNEKALQLMAALPNKSRIAWLSVDADTSSSAGQQGRSGTYVGRWELKAVEFKRDANKLQHPEENKYAYEEFRFAWDLLDEGLKAAIGFDPQNATDEQEKMLENFKMFDLQRKQFLIQTAKGDREFFKVMKNALSVPGVTCDNALSALALHFGADALAELFVAGFTLLSFMKDPETEPMKRMMKAKELSARVHGTAWKSDGFLKLLVVIFGLEEKHREVMIRKVSEWFEKNKTLPSGTLSNMHAEFEALSTV
uniref:Uncharacterized protein n=1 Tax=Chromera velia CCMP2878 TaxID=1169474 RepID=A0A0G4IE97_9ALVE|eukprot:Cvel_13537.t1-p1 / transcript=Cvel_13537.t1 / gene=Cvel_13537 / organism=Chromera_velia_CCMP2878 / gene_product=hypothetical protein / transcript_product=hypothetical protein / location=Cvel_scaffold929:14809-21453(+) / protein_length=389 / sequence_SO=supercontig / SO=protein_coding / is_pseudo=false